MAQLRIEIVPTRALDVDRRAELHALCEDAYGEDVTPYLADVGPGVHLLGRLGDALVSHAMYVERSLQIGSGRLLRTAYVELVATRASEQRRGHASALLLRMADEIQGFDIGALSPSDVGFYSRLGWEIWRGPLFVRTMDGVVATPDEQVMVLRLPRTPPVSLDDPISIERRPGEIW